MIRFRVFCGFDSRQAEAAEVFAYSVAMHTSIPIEIYYTSADAAPMSLEDGALCNPARCARRGTTAFSYSRFMIPHGCGYEGVALYADGCDMLCLGDVAELAAFPLTTPIAVVKHPPRVPRETRPRSWTSLMLMDCARLHHWTPDFVETAQDGQLMRLSDFGDDAIGSLPPEWNVLVQPGKEPPSDARIAHWSALSSPDIGPWIDASGSALWQDWRERWRASR